MTSKEKILEQMQQVVPALKHHQALGLSVVDADVGKLLLKLPYDKKIVGNPSTGIISGGALTALMDTACGFAAITALDSPGICPTLDLRIDYMRPAEPGLDVIGEAEAYRVTRNVVFARGVAYHEGRRDKPIAHCTATFMRLSMEHTQQNAPMPGGAPS